MQRIYELTELESVAKALLDLYERAVFSFFMEIWALGKPL